MHFETDLTLKINNEIKNLNLNKRCTEPFIFLEELVNIDSQIKNHDGILQIQKILNDKFKKIGFSTKLVENNLTQTAPLLICTRYIGPHVPTISFIGHSDVVTTKAMNPFRIDGNRVYGSGVADDKGGVVLCLYTLEKLFYQGHLSKVNVNVLISPNEETGSLGFHHIFKEYGKSSDYIFGLEPALHCGSVIKSRSGNRWYNINVKGKAAHSGRFGHSHINAAHVMSQMVTQFHILNDETKLRRANIGSFIAGNNTFNTISERASVKLDTRFSTFECRDHIQQSIDNIVSQTSLKCPYTNKISTCFYSIEDDCPPMEDLSIETDWYKDYLSYVGLFEDINVSAIHAGGAADINYFASAGKFLLDGLGPVGGGLHTKNEYIEMDSLMSRSKALELFIASLIN